MLEFRTTPYAAKLGWNIVTCVGFIPEFLDERDERSAKEQIARNYCGGWFPFKGFSLEGENIRYPGDPPYRPIATAKLRDETIHVYPHAWVRITQPDGTWEVARLD